MTCCSAAEDGSIAAPLPTLRLAAAIFLAANCMLVSFTVNTTPLNRSETYWLHSVLVLLTASVVALTRRKWPWHVSWKIRWPSGMNAAFIIGMAAACCYSLRSVCLGAGGVYFEVVSILVVVHTLGSAMKQASQRKVLDTLRTMTNVKRQYVRRSQGREQTELVSESALVRGDQFWVRAGEDIPVDATVLHGEAFVDNSTITGESFWASCRPGDGLQAGSRNIDGFLSLRADASFCAISADTLGAHIVLGVGRKARIEGLAERFAKRFVLIVGAIACLVGVYWWRTSGVEAALLNTLATLLVACPCAFGFATPIALWSSLTRLGRLGFLTRDTAAIERLADVDTMVFDKTGTLTSLSVAHSHLRIIAPGRVKREDLLSMLATAQAASRHPIAKAFVSASTLHVGRRFRIVKVRQLPGRGIEVKMAGRNAVHVLAISDWSSVEAPPKAAIAAVATLPQGTRPLAVQVDSMWVAIAGVQERIVTDTQVLFSQLQRLGVAPAVLSGDCAERVHSLGALDAQGGCTPRAKARHVAAKQSSGHRVCFIGDGLNDAMAMARSHVGIAIAGGAGWTLAAADFSMRQKDLHRIPEVLGVARQTMRSLRLSLCLAAAYNAVGVAAAAAGFLHPVAAACLMLAASLTVTYRSLRLVEPTAA